LHTTLLSLTPLIRELAPAPDPWDVCQHVAGLPGLLFLDSAGGPAALRHYSYLTAAPFRWLEATGRRVQITDRSGDAPVTIVQEADPFQVLDEELARYSLATIAGLPPFQGGAAGLFGYGLCHHLERLPHPNHDEFHVPDLALGFYDWVLAWDHGANRAWLIVTGLPADSHTEQQQRARRRSEEVLGWLSSHRSSQGNGHRNGTALRSSLTGPAPATAEGVVTPSSIYQVPGLPGLLSNFDRSSYLEIIERAVDYIHAGDCFQVNIAQRLLSPANISPLALYGKLRQRNPAPFAGLFDLGAFVVASSSPERFARVQEGHIETRPIKGTRPRGATPEEDRAQALELLASAKDRAENVMIVDLLRNDLGRVCRYGSLRVMDVCRLETYEFVHHLVSVVEGQLRSGLGPIDLLRAAFPGGSVTGAPKVRAMEIITELEEVARGSYCGCLGYIGFDGNMDTNILIRTFTIGKGWVQFPVGGGIVADSVPEREYEETWHKARGSLRALE
jgi:para-aminobenzoate synthetase component 1